MQKELEEASVRWAGRESQWRQDREELV